MNSGATVGVTTRFRHEAFMYADDDEYASALVPFIQAGLEDGDAILVVVSRPKIELLRSGLSGAGQYVEFADMAEVGQNPARIIPAWQEFLDTHRIGGRGVRGIGEPIWPARTPTELIECQRHEALLNVAFGDGPAWRLLCPYSATTLDDSVLAKALQTHPYVTKDGHEVHVSGSHDDSMATAYLEAPLPEPEHPWREIIFGQRGLAKVREMVQQVGDTAGMDGAHAFDLTVAASEIATNSLRHGGGFGTFRIWRDDHSVVCEFRDSGALTDPLAGRRAPPIDGDGHRGLWIANQLCDLVQIRVFEAGTVVRLHMRLETH